MSEVTLGDIVFAICTLVVAPLLFLFNKNVVKKKLIQEKASGEDLRFSYQPTSPLLGTLGSIGFALLGDSRHYYALGGKDTYVAYRFLCIIVPIIPLGCYRVSEGRPSPLKYGGTSVPYVIYGKDSWRFWEVLSIYISWYSVVAFIFGLLGIGIALFN